MPKPTFRYNPKTLRYERVKFSIWRTTGAFIAYLSVGFIFFVALNLLQNQVIETKVEKALKAENSSLSEYKVLLAAQIQNSNSSLGELRKDENQLREKLFDTPAEPEPTILVASAPQVATNEDWEASMNLLNTRLRAIDDKTRKKNQFFGERLSLDKGDVPTLVDFPSIAPVKDLNEQNLVSGFGIRINPFHKGNYHHDGMDIALPKGTEVISTGNGRVTSLSNVNQRAGLGNYVEISHGNGLVTRYAHLEKVNVTWGQKITQGQVIGLSGSSGGTVAPHLHYEVVEYGKNLDPLMYIVEDITADKHQKLALKSNTQNQSLD